MFIKCTYPLAHLFRPFLRWEGLEQDVWVVLLVVLPGELVTVVQQELRSQKPQLLPDSEVLWRVILLNFMWGHFENTARERLLERQRDRVYYAILLCVYAHNGAFCWCLLDCVFIHTVLLVC